MKITTAVHSLSRRWKSFFGTGDELVEKRNSVNCDSKNWFNDGSHLFQKPDILCATDLRAGEVAVL